MMRTHIPTETLERTQAICGRTNATACASMIDVCHVCARRVGALLDFLDAEADRGNSGAIALFQSWGWTRDEDE